MLFVLVSVIARGLGNGLAHMGAGFRGAVVLCSRKVVDAGLAVHPYDGLAWATCQRLRVGPRTGSQPLCPLLHEPQRGPPSESEPELRAQVLMRERALPQRLERVLVPGRPGRLQARFLFRRGRPQ